MRRVYGGRIGGEILSVCACHDEMEDQYGSLSDLILFYVSSPSSSTEKGGAISGTGCMVPQSSAGGGNQSYLDFWVITGDPWYLGYKTLTDDLEDYAINH
jgi:hypothetical protein